MSRSDQLNRQIRLLCSALYIAKTRGYKYRVMFKLRGTPPTKWAWSRTFNPTLSPGALPVVSSSGPTRKVPKHLNMHCFLLSYVCSYKIYLIVFHVLRWLHALGRHYTVYPTASVIRFLRPNKILVQYAHLANISQQNLVGPITAS